jgi:hypothetical protein
MLHTNRQVLCIRCVQPSWKWYMLPCNQDVRAKMSVDCCAQIIAHSSARSLCSMERRTYLH